MALAVLLLGGCWPAAPLVTGGEARAEARGLPGDDEYVVVGPDGHLRLDGRRVRYWGLIGWMVPKAVKPGLPAGEHARALAKARADVDLAVKRTVDLGFTSYRNWYGPGHFGGDGHDYAPGDGSMADLVAYFLWRLDQAGVKVWVSQINQVGRVAPDDVDVIDDPATAAAWSEAVRELAAKNKGRPANLRCGHGSYPGLIRVFDPRCEALVLKRMRRNAEWPNRYKNGLRLCDDPQNIVWELSNEEIWLWGMFAGRWRKLPAFFRNELIALWCEFLREKHRDDERLRRAWGFLLPGETLRGDAVMLAPVGSPTKPALAVNDGNPAVARALARVKQEYTRDDFTRQRGADVVEFFTQLLIRHKRRLQRELKTWGKSCRLSPCLWDAAGPFQVQLQYACAQGEALATCSYIKGMGHDPADSLFPFKSGLTEPPRICWDVPWMEQIAVEGKPTFIYETQIDQRTKYRAEYPARVAALGSIADWDIINWHIYGHAVDSSKPEPFAKPMHIWHDYLQFAGDEVQCSAMRACSEVFTNSLLDAPGPTVFTVGRRTLYDPVSMDYGRSYGDLAKKIIPTVWRYGLRFRFDLDAEEDRVDGPVVTQGVLESHPVRPTKELEFDWNLGHLVMDAPGVASYTGFYGRRRGEKLRFAATGAVFSDIHVSNPEGIAYPVRPDECYVAVTLASADGAPLSRCRAAVLSAVSTGFNTGYRLDLTRSSQGMHQQGPLDVPPREFWGAWVEDAGTTPVLVARVGVTVECPAIKGMRYTFMDWQMRPVRAGRVAGGRIAVPSDAPVFIVELERPP
jgi:hypothetical protein